jgi:hypothetical protein
MSDACRVFVLIAVLTLGRATAVGEGIEAYRAFGFSDLHSESDSGWVSFDMRIRSNLGQTGADQPRDSINVNSSSVIETLPAVVNVSVAFFHNASVRGGNYDNGSFQSVVCNGEPAWLTREIQGGSGSDMALNYSVTFPFSYDPNSCFLRFLWPLGCRLGLCNASGMRLSWPSSNLLGGVWIVGSVVLEQTEVTTSQQYGNGRPPPSSTGSRAYCGRHVLPWNPNETRHIRVDFLGEANQFMSIANASTHRTSEGGGLLGPPALGRGKGCRLRPAYVLHELREVLVGPREAARATHIPVRHPAEENYVAPPTTVGRLPQQPICAEETLLWFAAHQTTADDRRFRWFLPSDNVLVLIMTMTSYNQTPSVSDQAVLFALDDCAGMTVGVTQEASSVAGGERPSSVLFAPHAWSITQEASTLSESSTTAYQQQWQYCGDYGGTPSVCLDIWNVSTAVHNATTFRAQFSAPVFGSLKRTTLSAVMWVSSDGFDAPGCPVSLTMSFASSSPTDNETLLPVQVAEEYLCMGPTFSAVGRTPWYTLEYSVVHDRFWMATSIGAFPLTPCVRGAL